MIDVSLRPTPKPDDFNRRVKVLLDALDAIEAERQRQPNPSTAKREPLIPGEPPCQSH